MGAWEDFSRFLEDRLDEFLESNPRLKLLVLLENVRQQETEAEGRLRKIEADIEQLQGEIVAVARDVQKWQERVKQAQASGRTDLAQGAKERSDELLRRGNELWGQMTVLRQQLQQTQVLHDRIRDKRRELEAHMATQQAEAATSRPQSTPGSQEDLEARFHEWELDQEIQKLKRKS